MQLDESLTLNERLNSENRAGISSCRASSGALPWNGTV